MAKPLILWHFCQFGEIVERWGRKKIVNHEAYLERKAILAEKAEKPKSPKIQLLLKQAYELKERLERTPDLARDTLASEVGISPTRLTMILNLLNLAPVIQQHILSLPPSVRMGPLTERSLRPLARIRDWNFQIKEFGRILSLNGKDRHAVRA